MTGRIGLVIIIIFCCYLTVPVMTSHTVAAQQIPVPFIEAAERAFQEGVQAFGDGDYDMAERRFRLIIDAYDLNRKTTAAYLMAGKTLYRNALYQDAVDILSRFISRYPTSGYLDEARTTRDFALEQLERQQRSEHVLQLGIILPMNGDDATLSQALFTGIRIAVNEHNSTGSAAPLVRMVFRDTNAEPSRAGRMVEDLARSDVDAIIGPLYSGEARTAAAAAERAGLVLIAPLATDEDVSQGRRFVFQANPTIGMRGRLMARFAVRSLRLNDFGIVAERGTGSNAAISERMAEGFQEEVYLQGARVAFYEILDNARGWTRLPEDIGVDALAFASAVYLPVSGNRAETYIEAALTGLDRVGGSNVGLRVLGNAEWHDLPFRLQASNYRTTYSNDFYIDRTNPDVFAFERAYQRITGKTPEPESTSTRLAYTGYDVTRFLLAQMTENTSEPLSIRLRSAHPYEGIGIRIDFQNSNVNEAMFFHRYQDGRLELVR